MCVDIGKEKVDIEKVRSAFPYSFSCLRAKSAADGNDEDAKKFVYSCIIKKAAFIIHKIISSRGGFLLSLRFSLLAPLQRMLRQLPVLWQQETGARKASAE